MNVLRYIFPLYSNESQRINKEMEKMTKQDYWNATRYDTQHAFVSHYGKDILSLLQPQQGETIVDVGCGTGDLAHELSK